MPVYDYECQGCGNRTTECISISKRTDPLGVPCSVCGELKIIQIIASAPQFVYNRSGALKTDNTFNDRMKEIQKNTPRGFKHNLDQSIR